MAENKGSSDSATQTLNRENSSVMNKDEAAKDALRKELGIEGRDVPIHIPPKDHLTIDQLIERRKNELKNTRLPKTEKTGV